MKASRRALWVVVFASLVVTGCASVSGPSEDSRKKAAQLNAQLGANYLRQGKLNLADQKLRKALRQDDDNVDAQMTYALLQMRLGKPEEAEEHFRAARSLAPDDPQIQNNYGTFLCNQGEYDEGIDQFLQAAENRLYQTPDSAYANAGLCAADAGRTEDARAYLRKALNINPRQLSALRELAQLEYRTGRLTSARSYLERYHGFVRPSADTLLLATRIERRLGNQDLAESYGRKLLRNHPDSDQAQRFLQER